MLQYYRREIIKQEKEIIWKPNSLNLSVFLLINILHCLLLFYYSFLVEAGMETRFGGDKICGDRRFPFSSLQE